jgi:uncharacterized delta-60 repeat protein
MKKIIQLLFLCVASVSFSQSGTLDQSFNPQTGTGNANANVVKFQIDGKAVIGGDFSQLNNIASARLGRLNADGTTDTSFNIGTGFNNMVRAILILPDGKILVGGDFTSFNGSTQNRIVRLNSDGTLDPTFAIGTGANNDVYTIVAQADGKIILGGSFTLFNSTSKSKFLRLNADGSIDPTFNLTATANNTVFSSAVQPDGKILLAGSFTSCNGSARGRIARLNADGTLDTGFDSSVAANNSIRALSLQSDGKIVIGGSFTSFNGTAGNYIARLNSNSTIDAGFTVGSGFDYPVYSIVSQQDDKLVIGGMFFSYNTVSCAGIARLNPNGLMDAAFSSHTNAGTNAAVNSVAVRENGKILAVGNFINCNGYLRNHIASLNSDGSIDVAFYPFYQNGSTADGDIRAIAVQPDGKVLIGGYFNNYHGIPSQNIARLNADGSLDLSFNVGAGADGMVKKIAVTSTNKIILVGDFVTYNGVARNRIAQLNSDGSLDTSFTTSANFYVNTVLIQPDGKILIGEQLVMAAVI